MSGNSSNQGGAINCGIPSTLTISGCTISGNTATYIAGAIYIGGFIGEEQGSAVSIDESTISNNSTSIGDGGGIYADIGATLAITNSTLSGNSTLGKGGAIYCAGTAMASISGSILSGNSSVDWGGAIFNFGTLSIDSSTLSGNSTQSRGGAIDEVKSGAISLVNLGGDGVYRLRITDGYLTSDEHDYAAEVVRGLGLQVVSGNVYVGPGECLPGGGFVSCDLKRGTMLNKDKGNYDIDTYAIVWSDSPRWWNEEGAIPDDAPPDFVAIIRPRSDPWREPDSEPRLTGLSERFIFDSLSRRVGPEPGMILKTSVRKSPSGLTLKDCGPCNYCASLVDYSGVQWKDRIRFEVLSVDNKARSMTGKLVEVVV